ncbi:hypothetical protein [Listeria booriae]|uniref:hypothetical protein n=1 Tax=Listeria booriae TaxID=1552123 RepID=UPI001C89F215|nr:hypothetical protein [Listeria booriae]
MIAERRKATRPRTSNQNKKILALSKSREEGMALAIFGGREVFEGLAREAGFHIG